MAGQLKQYEREIMRARRRVEVAELDNAIDLLILDLIGRLSKRQHKIYQADRLTRLMAATPEGIVARRGFLLGLTDSQISRLTAPDLLTMEELAELVMIMQAIAAWLQACQAAGETDVTFTELCQVATDEAIAAREHFKSLYHREPQLTDLPVSVMRISQARAIIKLAVRTGIPLPQTEQGGLDA